MLNLLKTHFGFDQFLPLQEEIIRWVIAQQDAFVLMPTGGGKSLCFQLPALMLPGLTLVIFIWFPSSSLGTGFDAKLLLCLEGLKRIIF